MGNAHDRLLALAHHEQTLTSGMKTVSPSIWSNCSH